MGKISNIKAKSAKALALALAVAMAVPGSPSLAANYGDPVSIKFDPGDGPSLEKSSYGGIASGNMVGKVFVAKGAAGYPLYPADKSGIFANLADPEDFDDFGCGKRPKTPRFTEDVWPGYIFDGWYTESGKEVETLHYAYQYEEETTYHAVWKGDAAKPFTFTVEHYRKLPESAGAGVGDSRRDFFKPSWKSEWPANTPVSATFRRDIPGYKCASVEIAHNHFIDSEKNEKGEAAKIIEGKKTVEGYMPNDNMTVSYQYEPDPEQKFLLTEKFVDETGNTIKPPETRLLPVESEYGIDLPDITNYEAESVELTAGGEDDLDERGIVSAETAGIKRDGGNVTGGNMPNQAITFTCKYKIKADIEANLHIRYLDEQGNSNSIKKDEFQKLDVRQPKQIPVNLEPGSGYKCESDNIKVEGSVDKGWKCDNGTLTITPLGGDVTVTIPYTPDEKDPCWANVEFYSGEHGSFSGNYAPQLINTNRKVTLKEVTAGLTADAESHYLFAGWYRLASDGKGKTGDRLPDDTLIEAPIKLFADFEETPGDWFNLKFTNGEHGSIDGNREIHTVAGTIWSELSLPTPNPDENYEFGGWYNEKGDKIGEDDHSPVGSDQTYTAKFISEYTDEYDNLVAMPDAVGSIGNEGAGEVSVSGANENRRYALTDMHDKVIETKTGLELKKDAGKNGCFTGLWPCTDYRVYELKMVVNPAKGEIIHGGSEDCSYPTQVTVPALGKYSVGEDTGKTMMVTVKPAAGDTLYAVLDTGGTVIQVPGADEEGWVTPTGSPLKAELGRLEANRVYIVVAKRKDEKARPAAKLIMGTEVSVTDESESGREYTIELTNGGYITGIQRGDADIPVENDTKALVKAGDRIFLDADANQPFKQWECIIGHIKLDDPSHRDRFITMPEGNLVLQADYNTAATPGNAAIAYANGNGVAAPDLSEAVKKKLIEKLTHNESDDNAMDHGRGVRYIIGLNRRSPNATESNAVKAAAGEETEESRVLTSRLKRQVGGSTERIPAKLDSLPEIKMFYNMEPATLGYLDYRLWRAENSEGTVTCEPVPMDPDPNENGAGFTGLVTFDANVGSSYILTYTRAHNVKIVDRKRGPTYVIKVKANTALENADGFSELNIFDDYTDKDGMVWKYKGLIKEGAKQEYTTSDPVTSDLTLDVLYQEDPAWKDALQKLKEEIADAQEVENNPSVSIEDKKNLSAAIEAAVKVANRRHPWATAEELSDACRVLKDLVDLIVSGGDHPTPPDPPTPDDHGGGGGGGGGTSGRFRGTGYSYNGYITYYNGSDGSWETAGEKNDRWIFVLKGGQRIKNKWINVKNGDTQKLATYHLNVDGIMDTGWYEDSDGQWYYLDPRQGSLQFGWYLDAETSKWYYLNQFTGGMLTGWQNLGDAWYFLNPAGQAGQPLGSLYTAGLTPDGYPVDENGRWIRETP